MGFKFIITLLLVSALTSGSAFAQQTPEKKDSTHLYENIQTYSEGSKFRKFMYRLFFKPVAPAPQKKKSGKKIYKKLIQKPYSAFEGKTIRHINIETLDPFGSSIGDTIAAPDNFFSRTGNKLHIKSQRVTIRNLLLIHPNQQFDSLLVKESERLVRSRPYLRDVSFFVKSVSKSSDSIDVFIRALDIWSIIPRFSTSVSHTTVGFTDKNFLGLGHEFKNNITRNYHEGNYSYYTNYSVPNIRNTFVSTILNYENDGDKSFNRSLTIDRPFFSPFTRWAAGINFTQQFLNDSVPTDDLHLGLLRFKFNSQDYWAGNAIQLFKGNPEYKRTTNFISAVRFLRVRYIEKPNEMYDTQHMFTNENFYLAGIGVSTRKYVQDKFIFKYGITEDVPIGKVLSLTGGFQEKNNTGRFYLGARASMGNYYPWGYLSSTIEYGTFFYKSHVEEGVFTAGVNYFTGLIEVGKWKFRQFVKPEVTIGINRFASDSLTLNDGYGLDGFRTTALKGTSRLLLTLQTQAYAPFNFIGFRFGPYFIYSMGMLGDEIQGFKNSKVYSQIGIGVLIKNENLVLNTFQISLSFYPIIPEKGKNIFKINSFSTGDFGFRDFEIGKPGPVDFR
ncbi:MAG: hypothetical protein A2W90_11785 [Bacteroidetes bacterium GWF2_42_66]|nr:MAG: hypothetical protein A2W92_00270 [Bacteroidetes bacterium GWA2_42_15]OFY01753.1 MAG: hypothetical protein A2W89_22785 [Bacteroidetes bacterium GWE2_42_39]OFY44955.1 MAG: hypothetical protein A2W90_11785 [Bacteroidetes bacterium GWF2_42_66]HBL76089.1 hypothetical protein [Prolixibacteraceae bacterium]HCR90194.1 hypothetical protein [Prolixibacteraceae bacterium]